MNIKVQLILGILFLGFVVGGYEFYDFYTTEAEKMEQERAAEEAKISASKNELKRLETFAANIQTIKQEYKDLNQQLESALENMPRNFNFSALMRKMNSLADNSGVDIVNFRPKKGEEKEAGSFYSTTQIEFQVHGSFSQTLVFLDQLSRLKRIINIESLKIGGGQASPIKGTALSATLPIDTQAVIKTYRFSE